MFKLNSTGFSFTPQPSRAVCLAILLRLSNVVGTRPTLPEIHGFLATRLWRVLNTGGLGQELYTLKTWRLATSTVEVGNGASASSLWTSDDKDAEHGQGSTLSLQMTATVIRLGGAP